MDEAIKQSIESSITKLLHDFKGGLTTSALLDGIDEAEAPLQVSTVLNDMGRRGLVEQNKESKVWRWVAERSANQAAPAPDKKRHETAEAILSVFAESPEGKVHSPAELRAICSKWAGANVDYHIRALKNAGLLVADKNGGYHLPGLIPTARSKPPVRRPNTALLAGGRKPDEANDTLPPAAIPPAAATATPAPVKDITIELTCPNGRLKIDGTPKLVFGFLEQLKELAA